MPLAGERIRSLEFTEAVEDQDDSIQTNALETEWRAGSPGVLRTFIAPLSGAVWIGTAARFRCSTSNALLSVSYELRETNGSGTIILAEAVLRGQNIPAFSAHSAYAGGAMAWDYVGNLDAGAQYWCQLKYQLATSGSTSNEVRARRIIVAPAT